MSNPAGKAVATEVVNVIYIHTHDLGNWTGYMGKPVDTPHMDRLASASAVFLNAHAAAPTCSPSRAALLTGTTPHQAGMFGLAHRGFSLERTDYHLANVLKQQRGYTAALCGIQHEFSGFDVAGFPYDTVFGQVAREKGEAMDAFQRRRDRTVAAEAANWIGQHTDGPDYFLSVGFFQPHRPLLEADKCSEVLDTEIPEKLPVSDETRRDTACLKASIQHLDSCVGKVLDAIEQSGQWERTIILFTTDHGIAFPYHKCSLTDRGTHVALLLRHPRMAQVEGRRVNPMVSHLDVVPTIYEWLGMEIPSWCSGYSLTGLIQGSCASVRDTLYAEVNYHAAYEPMRTIRTDHYRLVRRFQNDGRWVLANVDDSLSKDEWLQMPEFAAGVSEFELYDLSKDPLQQVNVATYADYADVLEQMNQRLLRWMEDTDDPLLRGPVSRPPHSRVNQRYACSSHELLFEENR